MSATAENNDRKAKPTGSLARAVSQRKRKRLIMIGGALAVLAVAVGLMLMAFSQDIRFFRTPADLTEQEITSGARFRLGGLVEEGSVTRVGSELHFTVTDTIKTVKVVFEGIAPDLFREGQGVVAEGRFGPDGVFRADSVLAKHDENYIPKDLADSLKEKGVWEGQ
ncbi:MULTISPECIES: cytochrome c maturation protein CcmE [Ochrobactrum]|uniref:Cytochrome c-type biogenesis protein CcmE n=1 Tax=Ochrobactrum chromiisoli TaxID=2993941 RepID=A0ABT3QK72_9HYPH|nr:cytochrome c maturation protein CcmE [Ochrobactrum chromiisoli]MCX2696007.1 cytochrome c maturation protein CcmE [Ochrobactrum chromiisoli]